MLDIKKIRADFDGVAAKLATRGVEKEKLEKLHDLDIKRRELIVKSEALKAERNSVSDEISQVKRAKGDASAQIAAMQKVSAEIKAIDAELAEIEENLNEIIIMLPNLPHESTPIGADEDDNVEVRRVGQTPTFNFEPKAHWDLGEDLGILDWERGGKVTGSRFLFYKGAGARLERALYNFMLDEHGKEGYTEASGSTLVCEASKNNMKLVCVVLNGASGVTDDEAIALLNYGFDNFVPLTLPDDDFNRISGGTVIVPSGTTEDSLTTEDTSADGQITRQYYFGGTPVGTAVLEDVQQQADDAAETGQRNMKAAQQFSASHTNTPYYIIGAIGAAILLFCLFLMIRVIKS